MAPTTHSTAAGARAAAVATSEGNSNRAAARTVGLGLPALPGVGLASHGQPRRVASSCKRLARNVVSMAVGGPSAPLAGNEELTEFVNALKQEWDGIENKYVATTVAVTATLGMWSAGGVVSVSWRLLELDTVGTAFFKKVREFYEDIISG